MKIIRISVFLLGIALVAGFVSPVGADEGNLRIGVVDLQTVGQQYNRYRAAVKALEDKKAQLQSVVDSEEKEVLALIDSLEKVRATASDEELKKKREEIQARDQDLREFVTRTNIQFRNELDSLQVQIRAEIEDVVASIAKERKLDLVLEKGMLIFSSEALEITNEVVAELNRRHPAKGTSVSSGNAPSVAPTAFPSASQPAVGSGHWPFR
ncbi:MAG: OmpH family outer membrane protein [Candidatus Hydrogenedentota bacterium]|nr:MAG: OmpH family outer membrane protein [Candidatus Hydrogenedentota bacterium]